MCTCVYIYIYIYICPGSGYFFYFRSFFLYKPTSDEGVVSYTSKIFTRDILYTRLTLTYFEFLWRSILGFVIPSKKCMLCIWTFGKLYLVKRNKVNRIHRDKNLDKHCSNSQDRNFKQRSLLLWFKRFFVWDIQKLLLLKKYAKAHFYIRLYNLNWKYNCWATIISENTWRDL